MKPTDFLILVGGDGDCQLVILPCIGHSNKSRSTGILARHLGVLFGGFPNDRSIREE